METKEREREHHIIDEEIFGDYTGRGPWKLKDETYHFIKSELTDGDGEWHRVIVKRESDEKHFEFAWGYSYGNYYYEDYLTEVFPVTTITVSYE